MEWFVFAAPVPGPVEFTIGGNILFGVLLALALTPVGLVVRHALGLGSGINTPQLHVINGGKEVRQQAA